MGDPYLDPFANLDKSSFGSISGTITTTDGSAPEDYGVWLLTKVDGSDDPFEGEPAFVEFTQGENGTYTVKVAPGTYYVEAEGFDVTNRTPYKPRLHEDEDGNPATITIVDGSTSITDLDFTLKAEFRAEGKSRGKIRGKILSDGEAIREANIEAFPVDDEGELLSDHPVGFGWVEADGSYVVDAPEGKLKLVISTWDNSFAPQEVTVDLAADGLLEDQDFTLAARGLATVNGSVTDASGNPVHAEIIFIDADDEERYIWPKEFIMEEDEGEFSGNFTAKIPAGDYKVFAERWDGRLLPAYYVEGSASGASEFDNATTLTLSDNETKEGIALQLAEKPTATLTFTLQDSSDDSNIEWALLPSPILMTSTAKNSSHTWSLANPSTVPTPSRCPERSTRSRLWPTATPLSSMAWMHLVAPTGLLLPGRMVPPLPCWMARQLP